MSFLLTCYFQPVMLKNHYMNQTELPDTEIDLHEFCIFDATWVSGMIKCWNMQRKGLCTQICSIYKYIVLQIMSFWLLLLLSYPAKPNGWLHVNAAIYSSGRIVIQVSFNMDRVLDPAAVKLFMKGHLAGIKFLRNILPMMNSL